MSQARAEDAGPRGSSHPSLPRRFRFAPTPSRPLHIGSAWAALVGWSLARLDAGRFVLRIEDIDRTRSQAQFENQLLSDLAWLGLDWDEGPDVGGPFGPYRQSERLHLYDQALEDLARRGHLYACLCSRAEIRQAQSAPHLGPNLGEAERPYPGTCRPPHPTTTPHSALLADRGGLRLSLPTLARGTEITFEDTLAGRDTDPDHPESPARLREDLASTCGDVLLGRPGQPTYQLAVVVDDLAMDISDVVRGRDLLGSTARQLALVEALTGRPPTLRHTHHGLVVDADGRKLSKRDQAAPLAELRHLGPARLIAALGRAAGYFATDVHTASARDLADAIAHNRLRLACDLPASLVLEHLAQPGAHA